MYLPSELFELPYRHLVKSRHAASAPVLLLVALEPDALCACRILVTILKRDYIPHNIVPIAGYGDLERAGVDRVQPMRAQNGGSGGNVICLGTGGMVDLAGILGLEPEVEGEDGMGGVEVWVIDARRPWNLSNVFGGGYADAQINSRTDISRKTLEVNNGQIQHNFRPGKGGIIVFDDGDIGQLSKEQTAYFELEQMPDIPDDGDESDGSISDDEHESDPRVGQKRKSRSSPEVLEEEDEGEGEDEDRPRQRRRGNSSEGIPATPTRSHEAESDDEQDSDPKVGQKRKGREKGEEADNDDDDDDVEDRPQQRRRGNSSEAIPVTPSRSRLAQSDFSSDTLVDSGPPSPARSQASTVAPPSAQNEQENEDHPKSMKRMRRRLLRIRRGHEDVLHAYYSGGSTYSEPISSLMYRLASDLGQASNDNLWLACVGVQSIEQYGRLSSTPSTSENATLSRDELVLSILRDEVNRLNPPDPHSKLTPTTNAEPDSSVIPTHATSPTDTSIKLSPEPRLLLIRHWSLYESMVHSPYLATRLLTWTPQGMSRLHKLLAKMGVSLSNAKQNYADMNTDAKRRLRSKLLKCAPMYGLDGLLPPAMTAAGKVGWGFVRCWGWKACLSANDVGLILGAMLEVGHRKRRPVAHKSTKEVSENGTTLEDVDGLLEGQEFVARFWQAYDALDEPTLLVKSLPLTIGLHRAIVRTGTGLLLKRQVRHLRAFRMAVVKDGSDVATFTHPGALTKLALWLAEALQEEDKNAGIQAGKERTPVVLACLNEKRGVYVVVGTGGGGAIDMEERRVRREQLEAKKKAKADKMQARTRRREERAAARARRQAEQEANDNDDDHLEDLDELDTESEASDEEDDVADEIESEELLQDLKARSNRFGVAFQEVVDELGASTRIDNFENCVIEVQKEELPNFLEALSVKTVVG